VQTVPYIISFYRRCEHKFLFQVAQLVLMYLNCAFFISDYAVLHRLTTELLLLCRNIAYFLEEVAMAEFDSEGKIVNYVMMSFSTNLL